MVHGHHPLSTIAGAGSIEARQEVTQAPHEQNSPLLGYIVDGGDLVVRVEWDDLDFDGQNAASDDLIDL